MEPNKNLDFLEDIAGQGYDNIGGEAYATPFIKLLQSNSKEVTSELPGAKAGMFFDSANNVVIGNSINFIPIDFEILWLEWEKDMGGLKGKYLPNSIPYSGDKFNRINPATGRELTDSWCYYGYLADKPEAGLCILSLPVSAIKYLRLWNTQINHVKTPKGKPAAFFSSIWAIGPTEKEKNDSGQVWYNIGGVNGPAVKRVDFITPEVFEKYVKPGLIQAKAVMLSYQPAAGIVAGPVSGQKQLPPAPDQF